MNFKNIFGTDHQGIRRSHIKNLITVAMADGHLDNVEWTLLVSIAKALGTSEEEIEIIKNTQGVTFVPPKTYEEKVEQIQDLVAIMTIDGQINPRELELCKKISLKLDILPQLVDQIISDMFPDNKN